MDILLYWRETVLLCTPVLIAWVWIVWLRGGAAARSGWRRKAVGFAALGLSGCAGLYYLVLLLFLFAGREALPPPARDTIGSAAVFFWLAGVVAAIVGVGPGRLWAVLALLIVPLLWVPTVFL